MNAHQRLCTLGWMAVLGLGALAGQARADMEPGETRRLAYQGRLEADGAAASGAHDFRFGLFATAQADASCLVATSPGSCGFWWEEHLGVPVAQGAFAVELGSHSGVNDATLAQPELYLAIAVRESSGAAYVLLSGKQRLTPVAFAARAAAAKHFTVTGHLAVSAITPPYKDWNSEGTGAGGAAIYNDGNAHKKLMIVGNEAATAGVRQVGVYDDLTVNRDVTVTRDLSVKRNVTVDGREDITGAASVGGLLDIGVEDIACNGLGSCSCPTGKQIITYFFTCPANNDNQLERVRHSGTATLEVRCFNADPTEFTIRCARLKR